MSRRSLVLAGPLLILGVVVCAWDPPVLGRGGLILLGLLVTGLILLIRTVMPLASPSPPPESTDGRPADGEVPLVALPGVEGRPDEGRPAIKAFVRLGAAPRDRRARPSSRRRALRGRVALLSVFVGRDGGTWSSREISEAFDSSIRMGRWLEREAIRWRIPLNFEAIDTYFVADDPHEETVELQAALDPYQTTIDEADVDLRGIASASRAAARLGFADLADLIDRVETLVDHDLCVWFVHLLREGRSRALAPERYGLPGTGLALCYAREATASAPLVGIPYIDPVTLAHELLHLFGASDKYGTQLSTFPQGSVTSRDIMRLDFDRLGRLRVDPLTAFEVGWAPTPTRCAENRPESSRA